MTATIVHGDTDRHPIPAHRLGAHADSPYISYADVIARTPRVPGQLWERLADYGGPNATKAVVNNPAYTHRTALAYYRAISRSEARKRHPAGKALG